MENLTYWNKLKEVPQKAQKPIIGGRLKGMTDINPQWRLQVMTEVFGPVGIGWYYIIEKQWLEPGSAENVSAFCNINLYVKNENDEWSMPIPGTGGSSYIATERNGVHTSDEAFKMALTDALSVAMKALGVGANIYSGGTDYTKYTQQTKEYPTPTIPKQEKAQQREAKPPLNGNPELATDKQRSFLWKLSKDNNLSEDEFRAVVAHFGYDSTKNIKKSDVNKIKDIIEHFVSIEMLNE